MIRYLVAVSLLLPSVLYCQTGSIRGQVTDARSGEPLIGVNVIVVGSNPGHGAATDMNGMFLMIKVPPGECAVRASYLEYQTITLQNVKVLAGQTIETNFAMRREGDTGPLVDTLVVQKDTTNLVPTAAPKQ